MPWEGPAAHGHPSTLVGGGPGSSALPVLLHELQGGQAVSTLLIQQQTPTPEAPEKETQVMETWCVHCEYPAGVAGITVRAELPLQIMPLIYRLGSCSVLAVFSQQGH